jgi:eukaryotic-like serine/threonine-protein kinase
METADDGLVGRSVGNYQVISRIGEGGMGAVYLAHHAVLGRRAALKVLLPEYSNNAELGARFFTEARATAQLRHRGFVEVFDSGNLPDGSAYLVMEYLRGANLAVCIERRDALPLAETLFILADVAASLGFAHRHGIVHRDLKPDNIFMALGRDESSGADKVTIKVLDFGIAKLTTAAPAAEGRSSARTRIGLLLGTPLFMSPEQCRGAGAVDHRSDIYSLGCIAYNMLCGEPPFALEGFGEIIAAHLHLTPEPLRNRLPGLPAPVEAFVQRLLAKQPADRPQSMDAVIAALEELRGALPDPQAGSDLLPLVPPQAPESAVRIPAPAGPRTPAAATPMPVAPGGALTPVFAASSGGSKRLLREPGTRDATSSTLGGTASEIARPPRRPSGWRAVALGASLLAVGGIAAAGFLFATRHAPEAGRESAAEVRRQGAGPEPGPAPARADQGPVPPEGQAATRGAPGGQSQAPAPSPADDGAGAAVIVRVASTPPGATVVELRTGQRLGRTPFAARFPRATGEVNLVLRKRGYRPKDLAVKLEQDADLGVTLERKAKAERKDSARRSRKL